MKSPPLPAETPSDRIVLIPDADGSRSRRSLAWLGLALVAAVLLGGGIVYAWQQGQIRDRDRLVHTARVDAATAQNRVGSSLADATALRAHVAVLESRLTAQEESQNILHGQITQARSGVERTQARLADMRARLSAMTGPPVANGLHIAYIRAAGTDQSPPMIVVDLGRWFAGEAAHRAAIADGALTAGEHLSRGRYLRNTDHVWRILPVRRGALFTIHEYTEASGGSRSVTFDALASILVSPAFANARIAHDPFLIDVKGHRVASARQQVYRAP
jgi:uncharacterized coiled-coil protein SlyX